MKIKRLLISFAVIFAIAFLVCSGVNFLWNLVFHGLKSVDWAVSFSTAFTLGVIIPWIQEKRALSKDS